MSAGLKIVGAQNISLTLDLSEDLDDH